MLPVPPPEGSHGQQCPSGRRDGRAARGPRPRRSPRGARGAGWLALLLGSAIAVLPAAAPAHALQVPDRAAPERAPFRIVALGSSSTQGTGASSPATCYPAQWQRLFDEAYHGRPAVTVINRGVAGEDIDDMMRRIGADVVAVHPDLVIWQVGSNDPLRGVPMDRFKAELRHGIATIRASGAETMLMEPQWSPVIEKADAKSRFVEAVREVGAEQHVVVIRRFALMSDWIADGILPPADLIGPDSLHMTDRGYTLLAKAVLAQIAVDSQAFRDKRAVTAAGTP